MHHVQVDRVIDQPVDTVWAALDDFGGVYRYHPLVEKSLISNGISSGLGAERVCHFDDGNSIREEITAYEPGRAYEVEIVDPGKFPLKRAIARPWRLRRHRYRHRPWRSPPPPRAGSG